MAQVVLQSLDRWPCNSGCFWGWNPVQAGSCSPSLDSGYYNFQRWPNELFIQTRPRHWDTQLGVANFYVGTHIQALSPSTIAITYISGSPFSNAPASTLSVPLGEVIVNPTERWVGWFNGSGKGIALYVPQTSYWQTWKMGRINAGSSTNYIQNWALWELHPKTPYSTTVYLIQGTVAEIRAVVYSFEGY